MNIATNLKLMSNLILSLKSPHQVTVRKVKYSHYQLCNVFHHTIICKFKSIPNLKHKKFSEKCGRNFGLFLCVKL